MSDTTTSLHGTGRLAPWNQPSDRLAVEWLKEIAKLAGTQKVSNNEGVNVWLGKYDSVREGGIDGTTKMDYIERGIMACYAERGSNEGHYVTLTLLDRKTARAHTLLVSKTFGGLDEAMKLVTFITRITHGE